MITVTGMEVLLFVHPAEFISKYTASPHSSHQKESPDLLLDRLVGDRLLIETAEGIEAVVSGQFQSFV